MARRITDAQLVNATDLAESGAYRTVSELASAAKMSESSIRKYGLHKALPRGENAPSLSGIDLTMEAGGVLVDAWRRGFRERSNTALCGAHLMDMQLGGADHWERYTGRTAEAGHARRARERITEALEHDASVVAIRRAEEGGSLPIDVAASDGRDYIDCKWAAQYLEATAEHYTPQDISDLVVRRRRHVYGVEHPERPSMEALQRRVLHKIGSEECTREWHAQHGAAPPAWALNEIHEEVDDFIASVGLERNGR